MTPVRSSVVLALEILTGIVCVGGRAHKDARKGKASKAGLLETAKRRQEQLKSLEGTREGRVSSPQQYQM